MIDTLITCTHIVNCKRANMEWNIKTWLVQWTVISFVLSLHKYLFITLKQSYGHFYSPTSNFSDLAVVDLKFNIWRASQWCDDLPDPPSSTFTSKDLAHLARYYLGVFSVLMYQVLECHKTAWRSVRLPTLFDPNFCRIWHPTNVHCVSYYIILYPPSFDIYYIRTHVLHAYMDNYWKIQWNPA